MTTARVVPRVLTVWTLVCVLPTSLTYGLEPGAGAPAGPELFAQPAPLAPVPEASAAKPSPDAAVVPPAVEPQPAPQVVELYPCVVYRDERKIAPCAVPMIVAVPDPCAPKDCCKPRCVYVKICVPPCGCPKVRVYKVLKKVRYDYGRYAVDITWRRGRIRVDYDDGLL